MAKQSNEARNRNWTFLVYPDSAPNNWLEILSDELHLNFVVSPLHEHDINPDGTPKKAHYHILVCFEGNKSKSQIQAISDRCSGVLVIPCDSVRGLIQYMIHKNNPEKYQYNKEDIKSFGIDIADYFGPTPSEIQNTAVEMVKFIADNSITEFDDFVRVCVSGAVPDLWLYILMNRNTQFFKAYLSNRAMIRRENKGRDCK